MGLNLGQYDEKAKPSTGFANDLERFPDGDYELLSGEPEVSDVNGGNKIRIPFTVVGGPLDGEKFKHDWWLNSQEKVGMFLGDLAKMGFDTENWTPENNRPASEEIERSLKVIREGLRLKVKKITNKRTDANGEKKFHNLRIEGRGVDGKPEKIGQAELDKANESAFE